MSEPLSPNTIVKDVLDGHPEAVRTFIELGLMCVGCPVAAFHTLADVAREHDRDLADLLCMLNHRLESAVRPPS
jgi:hybrid cluster-associated redox disulfide protein